MKKLLLLLAIGLFISLVPVVSQTYHGITSISSVTVYPENDSSFEEVLSPTNLYVITDYPNAENYIKIVQKRKGLDKVVYEFNDFVFNDYLSIDPEVESSLYDTGFLTVKTFITSMYSSRYTPVNVNDDPGYWRSDKINVAISINEYNPKVRYAILQVDKDMYLYVLMHEL